MEHRHLPLTDSEKICPRRFAEAIDCLRDLARAHRHVAIACHMGESRSCSVVVGYLVREQPELLVQEAFKRRHEPLPEVYLLEDKTWLDELPGDQLAKDVVKAFELLIRRRPSAYMSPGIWGTLLGQRQTWCGASR